VGNPFGPLTLIADAASASALPAIERTLAALGIEHRSSVAESSPDAVRLASGALSSGGRFVVAVGGDAVTHDVVNGMFAAADLPEPPVLGVVPAGIDNAFFRQFGLPVDAERAAGNLAGDEVYPIDVGALTCSTTAGGEGSAFVTNLVEIGLHARLAPWTAGESRARTFGRFWKAVLSSRSSTVHVNAAKLVHDGTAWSIVIGNGRFGAGGFRVSPRAFPGDGVLEVLVHHGPRSSAFTSLPKAIRGEQVPSPHIRELRGNRVRVEADPPMPVAVDGRPFGRTPVTVDVLHRALLLKI